MIFCAQRFEGNIRMPIASEAPTSVAAAAGLRARMSEHPAAPTPKSQPRMPACPLAVVAPERGEIMKSSGMSRILSWRINSSMNSGATS